MKFVDSCLVTVVAGDGGKGCVAFRRELYIPHGGPAGGDGGKGGDVVFETDPGMSSLLDFAYTHSLEAARGENGRGKDQYGAAGENRIVRVPVGTEVRDAETGEMLFDLNVPNVRTVIARGGRGGKGNIHFATSTDRAPRRSEPGETGEQKRIRLELKVMADAGLLGFPNVGKSTFIRAVSRAHPKVADYPFTTLIPHLGVARVDDDAAFVIADIPGLIPGAAEGAGLGLRFLKHLERTRVLLHLVTVDPGEERDPLKDFDALMHELRTFDPELAKRPQVVAMTKADLPDVREAWKTLRGRFERRGIELHLVSAATGEGVRPLLGKLLAIVRNPALAADQHPRREQEEGERNGAPSAKRSTVKKPKKPAAKRTTASKPKKPAAKRTTASKPKKPAAKRTPVRKPKKTAAKRAPVRKPKKTAAKRAPARKPKKTAAKRGPVKAKKTRR